MPSVGIGLDKFHYAILEEDTESGVSYGAPVWVPNITEANINPNTDVSTFFGDDGPRVSVSQIGGFEVEITVGELPLEDYATLIGATYEDGVLSYRSTDSAPDVAVGFRAQKANGEYRYIWVFKGKFGVPEMNHTTKADSVEFQPQTIGFTGVSRMYDNKVYEMADSGNGDQDRIDNWFEGPDYEPSGVEG